MQCPACQQENPPQAKFCQQCGGSLLARCSGCGTELPAAAKFCHECGQPQGTREVEEAGSPKEAETAPRQPDAERRQLTVMFCDLVDSTRLAARLDPEDWREVVRAYQESCAQVIGHFGGQIAQYLGDGLLVYFGYPEAHEDDPVRAVSAALLIQEDIPGLSAQLARRFSALLEHALEARISIQTGPVVVGEMGSGAKREQLATGDTLNLAARLQGAAEPGAVVISQSTCVLVQGAFVLEDLGERSFKGVAEPVRVHRVVRSSGVQGRLELAAMRGLTPLVGREQEMALMLDRWERVKEGHGQALFLSGEAGMGKSRLVQTLRERLAEMPISWLECGCSAYHDKSAFHPWIELLEQGMLFRPDDPPEERLRKLEAGLERLGFCNSEDLLLMAALLSLSPSPGIPPLDLSPEARRRRTLELVASWIFARSEQQPLVLVVENLHWIDPSSLELLDLLIEQVPTAPVLLLLSFRPEFEAQWTLRSHLAHLTLHPLARREIEAMVAGITGGKALPAMVLEQVVKKTDGVPLFVEELTKSVLESGLLAEGEESFERTDPLPELAIPSTLQDSLMARLDRLGPAKEVAQLAAVLGRQFSFELLAAVSSLEAEELQAGLMRLVKAELLYPRGVPPRATYTFKHALLEDAAYQSLLRSTRQHHHARIAQVLEERFPERVAAGAEEMAHHCDKGGLTEKAISYYQRAAERAGEGSAHAEAIGHLTRAIELVQQLPEGPERDQRELALQVALGAPLVASTGFGGPEVERALDRARILCQRLGEAPHLADALSGLTTFYLSRGQLEDASELARQQLRLAERLQESVYLIDAHFTMAAVHYFLGEPGQALQHFDRASELYSPVDHRSLVMVRGELAGAAVPQWSAWALWVRGHPERSLQASRQAVQAARDADHPFSLAYALTWASVVHFMRREPGPAGKIAEEAIAIAERQSFPQPLGVARLIQIWARTKEQQTDQAVDRALVEVQEVLVQLGAIGTQAAVPQILGGIADICSEFERPEQAAGYLEAGLALSASTGQPYWDADLYRIKGEVALHREGGDLEEAESLFRRGVKISASQEAKSLELRAATSLARLWHGQGRSAEARELLGPVCDWFTEGFDTQDLRDAAALLRQLR